jgi:hypothetical protein
VFRSCLYGICTTVLSSGQRFLGLATEVLEAPRVWLPHWLCAVLCCAVLCCAVQIGKGVGCCNRQGLVLEELEAPKAWLSHWLGAVLRRMEKLWCVFQGWVLHQDVACML